MDRRHHLLGGQKRERIAGLMLLGGGGVNIALQWLPIWGHVLRVGGRCGQRFYSFWPQGGCSNSALGLRKRILFIKKEG